MEHLDVETHLAALKSGTRLLNLWSSIGRGPWSTPGIKLTTIKTRRRAQAGSSRIPSVHESSRRIESDERLGRIRNHCALLSEVQ